MTTQKRAPRCVLEPEALAKRATMLPRYAASSVGSSDVEGTGLHRLRTNPMTIRRGDTPRPVPLRSHQPAPRRVCRMSCRWHAQCLAPGCQCLSPLLIHANSLQARQSRLLSSPSPPRPRPRSAGDRAAPKQAPTQTAKAMARRKARGRAPLCGIRSRANGSHSLVGQGKAMLAVGRRETRGPMAHNLRPHPRLHLRLRHHRLPHRPMCHLPRSLLPTHHPTRPHTMEEAAARPIPSRPTSTSHLALVFRSALRILQRRAGLRA